MELTVMVLDKATWGEKRDNFWEESLGTLIPRCPGRRLRRISL